MALFNYKGKEFYIDGGLQRRLDNSVIPSLQEKDMDAVFCVDGPERSGKSVFSQTVAAYFGYKLNREVKLDNICVTAEEFRNAIVNAKKNDIIINDEAHRGMGSSSALSEINKILKDLMMEMGQKNLCVFIILPTFFELQKYQALFRTRGLFHIYLRKGKRGNWVYFNRKNKQYLYLKGKKDLNYNCMKWPSFRGRFLNQYVVDEMEYRKKKASSFKSVGRKTKEEKFKEQRDKFINIIVKDLGVTHEELANLCKKREITMKRTNITEIVNSFEE